MALDMVDYMAVMDAVGLRSLKKHMKKPKSLETKLRSAIRLIWSRSAERRAIIHAATQIHKDWGKCFVCDECGQQWPLGMAEVDHNPAVGALETWRDTSDFIKRMFFGHQRVVDKVCHKKITAAQRKKK